MNQTEFEELMNVDSLVGMDTGKALTIVAQLIDLSGDLQNRAGAEHAIGLLTELLEQDLSSIHSGIAQYYLGNAWSTLRHLRQENDEKAWDWKQEELQKEVIAFRLASRATELPRFPKEAVCCIFTNMGNALNHIGRFIEAIEAWDHALDVSPNFPMAQGNRGKGFYHYAASLYDDRHQLILIIRAREMLEDALKQDLHPQARISFASIYERIKDVPASSDTNAESDASWLGDTDEEIAYRKWCLSNRLFLNPLNDLGEQPAVAKDVFCISSVVVGLHEGPYYHGLYNQMKQEFVSARYLFYSGAKATEPHFSDKHVLLMNTMDYPAYCLAVENQKLAFRSAYSILDKIAFFLNRYLNLGISDHSVSFRRLWYEKQEKSKGLRPEFSSRENWPLRGLFWLSRDLYEDEEGFRDAMEPAARGLNDIRNHLEHKYLKVHEGEWGGPPSPDDETSTGLADSLAYSLRREDFSNHALRMLKLVRAALIYLSLAVHREETCRAAKRSHDMPIGGGILDKWEDDWKR